MLKIFSLSFLFSLVPYTLFIQNTNFLYNNITFEANNIENVNEVQLNTSEKYFDLTQCLPIRFVKDGSVDYTKYIQKGIDENSKVQMPDFPILINKKGIKVKSNSDIVFKKSSMLLMEPNAESHYTIILILNVSNVIIRSPKIIGERNQHKGVKGEWGMGIHIQASKNIQIFDPSISNCWGDGIYIGGAGLPLCENVKIINAKIDNCRRNGISITNGRDIQITSPLIMNTNGTLPMAGIDIEPNNEKATIDNIFITNPITTNNKRVGIAILLGAFAGEKSKCVRIKIDNHIDKHSGISFWIAGFRGNSESKTPLTGSIEINNPMWFNNKDAIAFETFDLGPKAKFKNIKIYKDGVQSKNPTVQQDVLKLKKRLSKIKNVKIE